MSASTSAVQRLNMFWFLVLSAPMLIGIAIAGLVWFGNYTASVDLLPQETLRMGAMGAMGLMLVVARPLRNVLLSPLSHRRPPGPDRYPRRPFRRSGGCQSAGQHVHAAGHAGCGFHGG